MMDRVIKPRSEVKDSPKDQTKGTKIDFAAGLGLKLSTSDQSASHGSHDSSSEEKKTKGIGESSEAKKDVISAASSGLSLENSQGRSDDHSSIRNKCFDSYIGVDGRLLQDRVAWDPGFGQREPIQVYTPGRWEKSKLKKICVDRAAAAWREIEKGHPERIWRRLTGNIPNEELYRFFKHADLEPGTYIDLGAGGGNFIHALGKIIGPEKMQIYAIDKHQAAYDKLREIASKNDKVKALHGDYTNEHFFEELRNNEGISNVSGILWANNGHYYAPQERAELMKKMKSMLNAGGKLLIVEYNTFKQHGPDGRYNKYPLPKEQLKMELKLAGFEDVKFLRKLPSSDQYMMYSAVATAPKRSEDKDVS